MAADKHKMRIPFIVVNVIFFLLFSVFQGIGDCKETPRREDVEKWAKEIDEDLMNINHELDFIRFEYERQTKTDTSSSGQDVSMMYEDVNEISLVEEMSNTLSEILSRKMEALKKSVEAAEKAVKSYLWKPDLEINDVHYYNSKTMIWPGTPMQYSERFGKEVNFNFSSVHIPVEIYEGSTDILNGLNWTAALDEQFKENYENDPHILWQYFGSQSGFMRTYPATNWNIDGVDLYDVRRQSWYTQGSSSPKDMLILIDTSGSTFGQSLQLMKNAVKSILNTLGENDFVNVVKFAEKAEFVSRCFNHTAFVQANYRNKKQLDRDVDTLSAHGQADFSAAIKFAFERFKEFSRNDTNDDTNIGANCNKVIMLLTDGGTDTAQDIFEEYNWPNKPVRVFTYAVGPTPNPINAVRWMACANRGYFSQIPAMGAIRSRVQNYIHVLERPLAKAQAEHALWSSSHSSVQRASSHSHSSPSSSSSKHLMGLGMMTTVTLPVYNHSRGSSNQTILGVMGVDVTTAQLEAHTPFTKIGPNGYAFAINPNGYVVFHPNLKTGGKFMKEPPNIDLLELEVEADTPDLVQLRTDMIKGLRDKKTLYTYFLSPDQKYVSYGHTTYAYVPIENTTFRLGVSVPTYQKKYPAFNGDMTKFQWPQKSGGYEILIAPWDYHKDMSKMDDLQGTLDDVVNLFDKDKNPDNWNLDLLYHLYWDLKLVGTSKDFLQKLLDAVDDEDWGWGNETESDVLDEEYFSLSNETDSDKRGVKSVFVMSNGGVTLFSPPSERAFFHKIRDLRKSSLYTRTLHSRCLLLPDHTIAKRSNKSSTPYITIACSIPITEANSNQQTYVIDKPAIYGKRVSYSVVRDAFLASIRNATKAINQERVRQNMDFPGLATCDEQGLLCYLVDDGGFLVATNRDDDKEQIGRFMGLVDPPLMSALNGTVFDRLTQYDFQASCKPVEETPSAGFRSFNIPNLNLVSEILSTGFWTSKVTWLFSSFNFFSWLFSPTIEVMAETQEAEDVECVKSIQQYYLKVKDQESITTFTGAVECDNCTRNYVVVSLERTKLLLVVSYPQCEECDDRYQPVGQAPRQLSPTEEEDIICQMTENPRNRIQAYGCYHYDDNEDQTECGCAGLQASPVSVVVLVSLVIWQWLCTSL